MAETFTFLLSPVTLAELDLDDNLDDDDAGVDGGGRCQRYVWLPGHLDAGVTAPCPCGDHEHRIVSALHTEVVENAVIVDD